MDGLGGTISVRSAGEGLGSVFTLTLPVEDVLVADVEVSRDYEQQCKLLSEEYNKLPKDDTRGPTPSQSLRPSKVVPLLTDESEMKSSEVRRVSRIDLNTLTLSDGIVLKNEKCLPGQRCEMSEVTGSAPRADTVIINRVLVVDDATSNRKMLCRLLKSRSVYQDDAEDGEAAVDKVRESMSTQNGFDAILMDFVMPKKDGPTATKELRAMGYTGLIVGITGNGLASDIEHYLQCGADYVLTKPLDIARLDVAFRQYLDRRVQGSECRIV